MRKKPSITDWIQAVAVVLALIVALWEFVLKDRESERLKKENISSLILAGQSAELQESSLIITRDIDQYLAGKSYLEYVAQSEPYMKHFEAWAFCYSNNLCNKNLALKYVCPDYVAFENIRERIFKANKEEQKARTEFYLELYDDCIRHKKG